MKILSIQATRRRLRLWLLLFSLALFILLGILVAFSWRQLDREGYFTIRSEAESMSTRISARIAEVLTEEEQRNFADYRFFRVDTNALVNQKTLAFSPLSEIPPKTKVPGLKGFYQINPRGEFEVPFLPDLSSSNGGEKYGLSAAELQKRQALETELRAVVMKGNVPSHTGEIRQGYEQEKKQERRGRDQPPRKDVEDLVEGVLLDNAASAPKPAASGARTLQSLDLDVSRTDSLGAGGLAFDKSISQKTFSSSARVSRRETVEEPASQRVEAYLPPAALPMAESMPQGVVSDVRQKSITAPQAIRPPPIVQVETEINPLQLVIADSTYWLFQRKAWKPGERYVQGFVVDATTFIKETIVQTFMQSSLKEFGSVILVQGEKVVWGDAASRKAMVIYRAKLSPPLGALEILVTVPFIPQAPGSQLIWAVTLTLLGVILLGLAILYRLGIQQLELAQKKNDFVSAVSHELKTPLTSIRMYAEMLRAGWVADPQKQTSYLDYVVSESERLSRLVTNVLHFAKLTTNQVNEAALDLSVVPFSEVFGQAVSKVKAQIEAAHFTLSLDIASESSVLVEVNQDAVTQIFTNVVDNALKFAKGAERKEIVCGYKIVNNSSVQVFIRDFGPGVEGSERRKVFDLFYRSGNELVRTTPGTGIGLALVKELAEQMRGSVDLINRSPGAEFVLELPAIIQ